MEVAPSIESIQKVICTEIEALLLLKAGSLGPDSDLTVLGIDSLRFVSLLLVIEEKFGVNLMKIGLKREDTQSARKMAAVVQSGLKA
jgi:acyl carrier protein